MHQRKLELKRASRVRAVLALCSHNSERLNLEVAARAFRRFLFATCIWLGLAFALVCYAEMLGVVQFD